LPGKTPEEAVEGFLEPLRQAAGCITAQPLLGSGYRPSPHPHSVFFAPRGTPVPLDAASGKRGIELFLSLLYRIRDEPAARRSWQVDLAGYIYRILDRGGREVIAYHWHPESAGPAFPHLHLSGRLPPVDLGPDVAPAAIADMHLPTGHVTLAAFVRLLIAEFGIEPLRADWESVLAASEERERRLRAD
jgi:hypothetical protein